MSISEEKPQKGSAIDNLTLKTSSVIDDLATSLVELEDRLKDVLRMPGPTTQDSEKQRNPNIEFSSNFSCRIQESNIRIDTLNIKLIDIINRLEV